MPIAFLDLPPVPVRRGACSLPMGLYDSASGVHGTSLSRVCAARIDGGIAQLVERLNGIQKVMGSTPFTSTRTPCGPMARRVFR